PTSGLNWAAERYLWAGGGGFLGEKAYNILGDMFFGRGYERYNAGRHDLAVPAQSFVLDRLIPGSQGAVKWIRGEPMTKREAEGFRRSLLAEGMLTDNLSMRLFLQTLREAGFYGEENETWDFRRWYYEQMKVKNK